MPSTVSRVFLELEKQETARMNCISYSESWVRDFLSSLDASWTPMAWRYAEMNRVAIRSDRCDVQMLMRSFTSMLSLNSIQSLIATTRFSTSPTCIQALMCVVEVITSADQRQRINWRWSCIAMGHLWFAHPSNLFGLCSHLWLNFLRRSANTKETSSFWHSGRRKESQMRTSS